MKSIKLSEVAPGLATGGNRSRQATQLINMPGRWCLYGHVGQLSHELDAGGPLDAPMVLPSGSVNSTDWRNANGSPVVRQTEYHRERGADMWSQG